MTRGTAEPWLSKGPVGQRRALDGRGHAPTCPSGPTGNSGRVGEGAPRARQTRPWRGRALPGGTCGPAVLKPYWGKPAVRNFRGARGNGATGHAKRARSRKRRIQPSAHLRATAPRAYSTKPHARFERGKPETGRHLAGTAPAFYQWIPRAKRPYPSSTCDPTPSPGRPSRCGG